MLQVISINFYFEKSRIVGRVNGCRIDRKLWVIFQKYEFTNTNYSSVRACPDDAYSKFTTRKEAFD